MAQPWKAVGRYGTVGFELILSIAIGWWVGHWLDSKFFPGRWYLTLAFTIGGVYTGFRALYKTAKKMEAEMERLDESERKERDARIDRAIVRRKLLAVEKEIDEQEKEK
jgi:ATP synthase protein I